MIEIGTNSATKRALLPARIKYWREQGQESLADRLQAEYDALTDGAPEAPPKVRTTTPTTVEKGA